MAVTDRFHMKKVDELVKDSCGIAQREITAKLGILQGHVVDLLKFCSLTFVQVGFLLC